MLNPAETSHAPVSRFCTATLSLGATFKRTGNEGGGGILRQDVGSEVRIEW